MRIWVQLIVLSFVISTAAWAKKPARAKAERQVATDAFVGSISAQLGACRNPGRLLQRLAYTAPTDVADATGNIIPANFVDRQICRRLVVARRVLEVAVQNTANNLAPHPVFSSQAEKVRQEIMGFSARLSNYSLVGQNFLTSYSSTTADAVVSAVRCQIGMNSLADDFSESVVETSFEVKCELDIVGMTNVAHVNSTLKAAWDRQEIHYRDLLINLQ